MAVADYERRNRDNMQALIDYLRNTPNPSYNSIEYLQAGDIVLLGKGHTQTDVDRVKNAVGVWVLSGTLRLYTDKIKKVFRPTEKKLVVYIFPNERKSDMGQLEWAIKAATERTSVQEWPIEYVWPEG